MNIIEQTVRHFRDQRHSGDGMCLKIALWAYQKEPRVELFYNSGHVICCLGGVCFDGGGVVDVVEEDMYMDMDGFGLNYFLNGFGPYLNESEKTILKQYFKQYFKRSTMSLSKQIKELERSIEKRTNLISEKQVEAQATNKNLQDTRVEAQEALQGWQNKIDGITADLNQIVQVITTEHEAKLREEGRLGVLSEMFEQSGVTSETSETVEA